MGIYTLGCLRRGRGLGMGKSGSASTINIVEQMGTNVNIKLLEKKAESLNKVGGGKIGVRQVALANYPTLVDTDFMAIFL